MIRAGIGVADGSGRPIPPGIGRADSSGGVIPAGTGVADGSGSVFPPGIGRADGFGGVIRAGIGRAERRGGGGFDAGSRTCPGGVSCFGGGVYARPRGDLLVAQGDQFSAPVQLLPHPAVQARQ